MSIETTPKGWHSIIPCLAVPDAARLICFLKQAFSGSEQTRITRPDGTVLYAELRLGDSLVLISDPKDGWKPRPSMINFYVSDVDATFRQAVAAGAKPVREPADMFYGDRQACVRDVAGNDWWITTHIEDVPADEIQKRATAFYKQKLN
jgi:PhnB protein